MIPRVSVVTIFLNAERYLVEAIDSVLEQDFPLIELLLVDDGSTDASTRIARDYAERYAPRIRYLEHPGHINRGMSASRNLGIHAAQGEFLAFLDADDVWTRSKISEQVAIMDAHPALGMVCGTVRYWESWAGGEDRMIETGHVRNVVVRPPEASLALYPLGSASAPCPSDILLRRDLVVALGGFEEHFTGMYEDQGFLAKLYLAAPVYFSDRVWLNYRQHLDSCVATVKRDGGYDQVRSYFLKWFESYIARQPDGDRRVKRAIRTALRPYRHPTYHRLAAIARNLRKFPALYLKRS